MDEPELPTSPRKKLKLKEPPFDVVPPVLADTVTEAPASPLVNPHDHIATTSHQLSKPTTMNSGGILPSPVISHIAAQIFASPVTIPEVKMEDLHQHSEAPSSLLKKNATYVSKARSADTDVADAQDDRSRKEAACGITEFVASELLGFSGILKKRYAFLTATVDK